jgi:TatD DNase family protein
VADSHCHLDIHLDDTGLPVLDAAEALSRAAAVGVTRIVQIGCELPSARWSVDLARHHDAIVAGVALHPNEAPLLAARGELDDALAEIEALAGDPRVRVVGETGLDRFRTGEDGWAVQEESFRAHIAMAKRLGKVLQIHDRDAHDDVLRVLESEGPPEAVVFHCFSGDVEMARRCVDRGYVLSFAGTVTFKNAEGLREALRVVPLDQLLVETDAPFLTPVPYRGRPNASYLVPHTVRAMASVKRVDLAEICAAIDATTDKLFGPFAR